MALALAVQSNTLGVTCLTEGKYQQAFSFFNEALLRCSVAALQAEEYQEAAEMIGQAADDASAVMVVPHSPPYKGRWDLECCPTVDDVHPISLFNQALLFSYPDAGTDVVPGTSVVSACTATVMFNMALSLCQGSCSQRRKSVKNAAHLFEAAISLMEQLPTCSNQMLVTIASLNNKACVFYHAGDLERSKKDIERLVRALAAVKQNRIASLGFRAQDVDGFFLGAISVRGTQVARAA